MEKEEQKIGEIEREETKLSHPAQCKQVRTSAVCI